MLVHFDGSLTVFTSNFENLTILNSEHKQTNAGGHVAVSFPTNKIYVYELWFGRNIDALDQYWMIYAGNGRNLHSSLKL